MKILRSLGTSVVLLLSSPLAALAVIRKVGIVNFLFRCRPACPEDFARALAKSRSALSVLILVVFSAAMLVVPAVASAEALPGPIPQDCLEIDHHVVSPLVTAAMEAGIGYMWQEPRTNSIIFAAQIAECGGAWVIAIWRSGNFQTNFFPAASRYLEGFRIGTRVAWSYIANQVRGWIAVAVSTSVTLPAVVLPQLGGDDMQRLFPYIPTTARKIDLV